MFISRQFSALILLGLSLEIVCQNVDVPTRLGSKLDLSCNFASHYPYETISWRLNGELIVTGPLKLTSNPRLTLSRQGAISIRAVERADIGTYVCYTDGGTAEQQFVVRLADDQPRPTRRPRPEPIILPPTYPPAQPHPYPDDPYNCQQIEQRLTRQLQDLTYQLQQMSEQIRNVESNYQRLEYVVRNQGVINPPPTRAGPTRPPQRPQPSPYNPYNIQTPQAESRMIGRKKVHEYIWVIPNFQDEIYQANVDGNHVLQTNFLTKVPGYNMTVTLYPNQQRQGYISLYGGFIQGSYDSIMPWPFRQHYEFAFVSHASGVHDSTATIEPFRSRCESMVFDRPNYYTTRSCGFNEFMSVRDFQQKTYAYLNHGRLYVRIRISDPE